MDLGHLPGLHEDSIIDLPNDPLPTGTAYTPLTLSLQEETYVESPEERFDTDSAFLTPPRNEFVQFRMAFRFRALRTQLLAGQRCETTVRCCGRDQRMKSQ